MPLTIKKILEHERLEGVRLVAGKQAIDNEVHNINTIDNPESYEWFTAGDFLLTTGYVYKDDPQLQKELIQELAKMNISGLGIKIKRYWNEIPQIIIDEANRLNFPVIETPYQYSLAQITNILNDEIFKRESSQLTRYKNIHDAFSKCSLSGGDLHEITRLASDMINNPILMLDSQFNLLAYHDLEDNPHPLREHFDLNLKEKPFDKTFNASIPTDAKMFSLNLKREIKTKNHSITCRIKPIVYANVIYGYVVVWETMSKLKRLDYITIESAAVTAALERIKTQQLEETKYRQRKDFFDDLLEGKILSNNALRNLAPGHGLNPEKPHIVMAVKTRDLSEHEASKILKILQMASNEDSYHPFQVIHRHDHFLLFIQISEAMDQNIPDDRFKSFIAAIIRKIDTIIPGRHKSGISNITSDFINIRKAAMLALDVINLSQFDQKDLPVAYFHDLISYHLIDTSVENDTMLAFFEETLGPLHAYDQENNSDLLRTLQVYFEAGENISLASKKIFIHRNSFNYRLDKIKEILKTDLQDSEENFSYQLAIKIFKLLQLKSV